MKLTASGVQSGWSSPTFTVEVKDPCPNAAFTVSALTNPAAYAYSGVLSAFTIDAFAVTPSLCPVTYSCRTKSGPTTPPVNICAFNTGTNDQATFSGATWAYRFTDTIVYPPGTYTLEIKASAAGGAVAKTCDF